MGAAMRNLAQVGLQRPTAEWAIGRPRVTAFRARLKQQLGVIQFLSHKLDVDEMAALRICAD